LEVDPDLLGEDGWIAANLGVALFLLAIEQSAGVGSTLGRRRQDWDGQGLHVRAVAAQLSQALGQRRLISQAEERGREHDVRNPIAQRRQCSCGSRRRYQFRLQVGADERAQLVRLVLVRFDGENERHRLFGCGLHDYHEHDCDRGKGHERTIDK